MRYHLEHAVCRRLIPSVVFLLTALSASAQITIAGRVTDAATGRAVGGAYLSIEGTSVGVMAVGSGEFRLRIPAQYVGRSVNCAIMGYRSASVAVPVSSLSGVEIELEPLPLEIGEVVVMPEDRLRILLEAAYRKIPENYYMLPTQLTGFYRESSRNDAGDYQYFSEAVVDVRIDSYEKSSEPQIRIVKSVANEFPALDSVRHRWINGVFGIGGRDFVKQRYGIIDPSHYKDYRYRLDRMTELDGRSVYVISFVPHNDSRPGMSGELYIDEKTLAYLGSEWERNDAARKRSTATHWNGLVVDSDKYKVEYARSGDGKMYLKSYLHRIDGHGEDLDVEYVTTRLSTDSVGSLSYDERVERSDVFLEKAKEYHDEGYWEEYNVFARDSTLDAQLRERFDLAETQRMLGDRSALVERERRQERRRNRSTALRNVVTRLSGRFGVMLLPATGEAGLYELAVEGTPVSLSQESSAFSFVPGFSTQIDYSFSKRWSVTAFGAGSFGKKLSFESAGIGAGYEMLLNRWGRPWIVETGVQLSYGSVARNFSDWEGSSGGDVTRLFDKKFDAQKVRFGVGYTTWGFTPRFGLRHRISPIWWIHASAGLYLPVWTEQRVFAKEKSGFILSRSRIATSLSAPGVSLRYNGAATTESHITSFRWMATFGIMYKY